MKARTKVKPIELSIKKINYKTIIYIIGLLALSLLPYKSFLLSPFFIPIIAIALSISLPTYLFTLSLSVLLTLPISPYYSLELLIAFTLFTTIAFLPFKFKNHSIQKIVPVVLTQLIISSLYLTKSIAVENIVEVIISNIVAITFYLSHYKIMNDITYRGQIFKKNALAIVLFLPLLFSFNQDLAIMSGVIGLMLFALNCKDIKDKFIITILMSLIFKYLIGLEDLLLLSLVLPIFITILINSPRQIYLTTPLLIISHIVYDPLNFYRSNLFYLLIIAILLTYLLKELIPFVIDLENGNTNLDVSPSFQSQIAIVKDYLFLLGESCKRATLTPENKIQTIINKEVCEKCSAFGQCGLNKTLASKMNEKIDKDEVNNITRTCLYPSKITYRLRALKPQYEREVIKYDIEQELQLQKLNEINHLIEPLENILEIKNDSFSISNLYEVFPQVKYVDQKRELIILKTTTKNIGGIIDYISDNYSNYSLSTTTYDYLNKCYIHKLVPTNSQSIEIEVLTKSVNNISGDTLFHYRDKNCFNLILSDGMGHDDDSYKTSRYLVKSFTTLLKMTRDENKSITEVNRMIKERSINDDYATLDFLTINMNTLKALIYKHGSYTSYLYRDKNLYEYNKVGLPLGIVDDLEISKSSFSLIKGDIFILSTDGFNISFHELLEILKTHDSLKSISLEIDRKTNSNKLDDDLTCVLLKIV